MDRSEAAGAEALRRFAEIVAGDPRAVPLDAAALAMATVLRPRTDPDEAETMLDELAAECPTPTLEGIRRHLYDDLRFGGHAANVRGDSEHYDDVGGAPGGDSEHYDDPRNSFLDLVLARRTGLPILLGTVVIEVGRRLGVPVAGVNLPLHFVVRDVSTDDAFLDPFTGTALDTAGVRELLARASAGTVPWYEHHLRPVPPRAIVIRMLTNLQHSYRRRHDPVRRALVAQMRATIPELATEAPAAARLAAVFN